MYHILGTGHRAKLQELKGDSACPGVSQWFECRARH